MVDVKRGVDTQSVIKQLSRARVEVGFFAGKAYPDGTPIAYVAAIHEYGSVKNNIPARSFFRPAVENNKEKHIKLLAQASKRAFDGGDLSQGLEVLGQVVVGDIKDAIKAVTQPALQSETVKRKGFSKPLVDTSMMLNSVEYVVDVQ